MAQQHRSQRQQDVESLVEHILDTLLAYGAFDPYFLDVPFEQSELAVRYFLNGGRAPTPALHEIAGLLQKWERQEVL